MGFGDADASAELFENAKVEETTIVELKAEEALDEDAADADEEEIAELEVTDETLEEEVICDDAILVLLELLELLDLLILLILLILLLLLEALRLLRLNEELKLCELDSVLEEIGTSSVRSKHPYNANPLTNLRSCDREYAKHHSKPHFE